jgi:hypothetical protein
VESGRSATLSLVFAGSTTTRKAAEDAWANLARDHATLLIRKLAHYAAIINRARIRIPDQRLQEITELRNGSRGIPDLDVQDERDGFKLDGGW